MTDKHQVIEILPDGTEWRRSTGLVEYPDALAFMEQRAADIYNQTAPQTVWLLEHPPLYTGGTSADAQDLLTPDRFPVFETGRGGQYTYHGPGQRVAYVMLDLNRRGRDIRAYVQDLEAWLIATLGRFGVTGERREGRVGIWVARAPSPLPREDKIAALGVRVRRWITFHGVALNVAPDLSHFDGIVPCGIADHGVTSLDDLGVAATMTQVDAALQETFLDIFQ